MKKVISALLLFAMLLTVLVSCGGSENASDEKSNLDKAKEYIYTLYKDKATETAVDYKVLGVTVVDGVSYTVTWSTDKPDNVSFVVGDDKMVTVKITKSTEVVEYTLTATISDKDGKTATTSFKHTIPAGKPQVGEKYSMTTSLKDGDKVIIYAPAFGMALSEEDLSAEQPLYRKGELMDVVDGAIRTDISTLVWDVKVVDGGYQFLNDNGETLSYTDKKLLIGASDNVWTISPSDLTENAFYIQSTTGKGSSGDPYSIEWYDQYSEFSVHYYSTSSEKLYAMQLFTIGGVVTPIAPTTDAEKVATEKEKLTALPATVLNDCEITLATAGSRYSDVTISWTSDNACAVVNGSKLVITLPKDAETSAKITATLTCGEVTETVEYTVVLPKAEELTSKDFTLTTVLKDGDKVIIYCPGFKKVMSEEDLSETQIAYRKGDDLEVTDNTITTENSLYIWNVVAVDGGYKFIADNGMTLSCTGKKLPLGDSDNVWALVPANTENCFYIQSTSVKGTSGDPASIEWYDQYSEFSAHYYSEANEALYALQLYTIGGAVVPVEGPTASEKIATEKGKLSIPATITRNTEIILNTTGSRYSDVAISWTSDSAYAVVEAGKLTVTLPFDADATATVTATLTCEDATETVVFTVNIAKAEPETEDTYTLTKTLKDGDKVVIYCPGYGKAMSEEDLSEQYPSYRKGVDVTVTDNTIKTGDSLLVWEVKAVDGGYQFIGNSGETLSCTGKKLLFGTEDNVWVLSDATTENCVYISSTTFKGTSGDPASIEWYNQYSEFSVHYYSASNEALYALQLFVLQ